MGNYNWESVGPGGCDSHNIEHPCGVCITGKRKPVEESKTRTCEDYFDSLHNSYCFDSLIDEAHWGDDFNAESFFEFGKSYATESGVLLTDLESFDYETYFWTMFDSSEKGLS